MACNDLSRNHVTAQDHVRWAFVETHPLIYEVLRYVTQHSLQAVSYLDGGFPRAPGGGGGSLAHKCATRSRVHQLLKWTLNGVSHYVTFAPLNGVRPAKHNPRPEWPILFYGAANDTLNWRFKDNMEYLQHDMNCLHMYEPLILCLSCDKWSCGTYQNRWKEWNALIRQRCCRESRYCQSTDTERHYVG